LHFFENEKLTSVAESYKTTCEHKADITVVLMSVVELFRHSPRKISQAALVFFEGEA
jgi:hypothetical protein